MKVLHTIAGSVIALAVSVAAPVSALETPSRVVANYSPGHYPDRGAAGESHRQPAYPDIRYAEIGHHRVPEDPGERARASRFRYDVPPGPDPVGFRYTHRNK